MIVPDFSLLSPSNYREVYIKRHFPEFYEYINRRYIQHISFSEKLYLYMNNLESPPSCKFCGGPVSFRNARYGYNTFCCYKCANNDKELKTQRHQTNLKKYGGTGTASPILKEKQKQTFLTKYGVDSHWKSEEIKEKQKQTFLTKYGVDNPLKNKSIREKIKQTNIEKYGVDNPFKSQDIREKIKQTNIEKYGTEWNIVSENNKQKSKETKLLRYGNENYNNIEQCHQTKLERYGNENYNNIEQCQNTKMIRHNDPGYNNIDKIHQTNIEKYGVDWACQRPEARNFSNNSKPNQSFAQLLEDNNILFEREFVIENRSYDFKIGNILIEIDPYSTHNSTWGLYNKPKEKNYHRDKSLLAKKYDFQCIHVWDWDDKNKIINILKSKENIMARKCVIKEVNKKNVDSFLKENHLQGTCRNQIITLGLYFNDELVELMTFGKPRYNKKYEYELLRLCTKNDKTITGGTEKLFKYFINTYKPGSIVSYCDDSKFVGNIYEKLGFDLKSTSISKHWYNGKTHVTDNLLKQRGFDQLFKTDYGKGTSNERLMLEHGFVEIYDAGQSTYIWTKKEDL